jgi:hypothetical protein
MSPLDAVLDDLRAARPAAPPELRERVRAIAATVPTPRRRVTWRRAAIVLVPAVLAVVVGAAVLGRGDRSAAPEHGGVATDATQVMPFGAATKSVAVPPPSSTRLQDYDATLTLRVRDAEALSDATKRAVRIAGGLGGFPASVSVHGATGTLKLRVPVTKVQTAVERLSAVGTIVGESVSIRDVQAGVNATDRTIARLQRDLRRLRANGAPQQRVDALVARIERLQRARANAVRQAKLATVELHLTAKQPVAAASDGPLDGAVTALRWLGIGALYALVVGGPVVAVLLLAWLAWRRLRRRAAERLLGV